MDVFLDNRALGAQPTFAAALRAGMEEAGRSGRVVVEVMVDGAAAPEGMLESPPEEAVGREVRLTSVEPRALVRVTLMDAADALESAAACQRSCAELIQSGKVEESLSPLSSAVQTWQAVKEAVEKGAALVELPLDEVRFGGGGGGEHRLVDLIGELSGRLEEVKRCLGAEDWSGLADVMAYDMAEQAQRWRGALEAMAEGLRSGD